MQGKKLKMLLQIITFGFISYIGLSILAKHKKANSVYDNEPEEQNQEANSIVTNDVKKNDCYKDVLKRIFGKVLSFCGLVVLSPVLIGIAVAIVRLVVKWFVMSWTFG